MEFLGFQALVQRHFAAMVKDADVLFTAAVDGDALWATYLDSFPPGTNELYRERREYDCSCCRHFIKSIGAVVTVKNGKVHTIWDFKIDDSTFGPVAAALSAFVKRHPIGDVFVTNQSTYGTASNVQQTKDGRVITWHHFHLKLPAALIDKSGKTVDTVKGALRSNRDVFQRSLDGIAPDAVSAVLELIAQNSLYKGEEWREVLKQFAQLQQKYRDLPTDEARALFCWERGVKLSGAISKIKNHSIGKLLTDITEGVEIDAAVKSYEAIVAPANYKRPRPVFTTKMLEQAKQTLASMGLLESLPRRHAHLDDISVANILFVDRDAAPRLVGGADAFADLAASVTAVKPRSFDRAEEISAERFVHEVLPTAKSLEVLLENKHAANMMSLIAPANADSKPLFKWRNGFSWAYTGNITDSMRERVKAAGGSITGVLRFSLQWNTEGDNRNDFDAHCIEPGGNLIYYGNKSGHASRGTLDVDIIHPNPDQVAIENITWPGVDRMREGRYQFLVHNFAHRGGRSGFTAEIEFDGQVFSFECARELRQSEKVLVAEVTYSRKDGFSIVEKLPSSTSTRSVWGLQTNQFHPVTVAMFSPNYWDGRGVGNRHYCFMLKGAVNDEEPNGFYIEFLDEALMPHRRVFEALGAKMRVTADPDQLSGIGFSSTQPATLICRVTGNVSRIVRVVF